MNLGEFIIKIGTQGDTKELQTTIKRLQDAEKKSRGLISYLKRLKSATNEQEKALIKKNYAQQLEIEKLNKAKQSQDALATSMKSSIGTAFKMITALGATITVIDRMGNSLIKANQAYTTFSRTTGMSTARLNRMAGIAQMSSTGLSPEQVMGDLKSLEDKIWGFERMGENAQTFGMLGINPRGMRSDQLLLGLRKSLKNKRYDERAKSRILSELGLSQEWINFLDLEDEKFNEYLKTSKKLQLNAKERKQLADMTAKQQINNMRWELAKQKLLISIMPMIQDIMEKVSKVALWVSDLLEKNPKWLNIVRDILLILTGSKLLQAISAISKLFTGGILGALGGMIGAKAGGLGLAKLASKKGLGAALGLVGKRLIGAAGGFLGGPVVGAIFTIASACLLIKDIKDLIAGWFGKKEQEDEDELSPDPNEGAPQYRYSNYKSNMTNNFFNNPQPAQEAIRQLSNYHSLILAEQTR